MARIPTMPIGAGRSLVCHCLEYKPGSTCALTTLVCPEAAHLCVAVLHAAVPIFRDESQLPLPAE